MSRANWVNQAADALVFGIFGELRKGCGVCVLASYAPLFLRVA
jgi:hypothetical protein